MAATVDLLDFLAPAVASMGATDKQKALDLAEGYRPACLPKAKQDEAQVWYAAWLLYGILQQRASEGAVIPAGVVSEKEGDLARVFGNNTATADAAGFYSQYTRLADVCMRLGAITTGAQHHGCR